MAQVSADMMGMSTILYMEQELESMGFNDGDSAVIGVVMANAANMPIKQSTKKLGLEATMKSCKAKMKQIHMRDTMFKTKHRHEVWCTPTWGKNS